MTSIFWLVDTLFSIAFWVILGSVIMSWLIAFNIVNAHNPTVRQVRYALHRLTEPVLGPIRRILPDLGGIDISPIILLLVLEFLRITVLTSVLPAILG
jgi:YggT family protein